MVDEIEEDDEDDEDNAMTIKWNAVRSNGMESADGI